MPPTRCLRKTRCVTATVLIASSRRPEDGIEGPLAFTEKRTPTGLAANSSELSASSLRPHGLLGVRTLPFATFGHPWRESVGRIILKASAYLSLACRKETRYASLFVYMAHLVTLSPLKETPQHSSRHSFHRPELARLYFIYWAN